MCSLTLFPSALPPSLVCFLRSYFTALAEAEGGPLMRGPGGELLMPLHRLVAEVTHRRPSCLEPRPTPAAEPAPDKRDASNTNTQVFRAPARMPPRREVEEAKALLHRTASGTAFSSGGTAGALLREMVLDCVDTDGFVDGAHLHVSARKMLKCGSISRASCDALVSYFAAAHALETQDRKNHRGVVALPTAAVTAAESGDQKVPLAALLFGLGADMHAGGQGALNIGANNFLSHGAPRTPELLGDGGDGGASAPMSQRTAARGKQLQPPGAVAAAMHKLAVLSIDKGLAERRAPRDVLEGLCVRHAGGGEATAAPAAAGAAEAVGASSRSGTHLSKRRLGRVLVALNPSSSSSSSGAPAVEASASARSASSSPAVVLSKGDLGALFHWFAVSVGPATDPAVNYKHLVADVAEVVERALPPQKQQQQQPQPPQQAQQARQARQAQQPPHRPSSAQRSSTLATELPPPRAVIAPSSSNGGGCGGGGGGVRRPSTAPASGRGFLRHTIERRAAELTAMQATAQSTALVPRGSSGGGGGGGGGARPASAGAAASRKLRGTGANWQGLEHRKGHHPGYAAARPSRGPSGVDAQTCLPFGLRTQGGGGGGGGGGGNETMPTLLLTCNDGVDKGVPHSMRWTGERHIDVPP